MKKLIVLFVTILLMTALACDLTARPHKGQPDPIPNTTILGDDEYYVTLGSPDGSPIIIIVPDGLLTGKGGAEFEYNLPVHMAWIKDEFPEPILANGLTRDYPIGFSGGIEFDGDKMRIKQGHEGIGNWIWNPPSGTLSGTNAGVNPNASNPEDFDVNFACGVQGRCVQGPVCTALKWEMNKVGFLSIAHGFTQPGELPVVYSQDPLNPTLIGWIVLKLHPDLRLQPGVVGSPWTGINISMQCGQSILTAADDGDPAEGTANFSVVTKNLDTYVWGSVSPKIVPLKACLIVIEQSEWDGRDDEARARLVCPGCTPGNCYDEEICFNRTPEGDLICDSVSDGMEDWEPVPGDQGK